MNVSAPEKEIKQPNTILENENENDHEIKDENLSDFSENMSDT